MWMDLRNSLSRRTKKNKLRQNKALPVGSALFYSFFSLK